MVVFDMLNMIGFMVQLWLNLIWLWLDYWIQLCLVYLICLF